MAAVELVTTELPVIREKIHNNNGAIHNEEEERKEADNSIKKNYIERFNEIKEKLEEMNKRLWTFLITVVCLFITAGAGVIITMLSGK